MKQWLSKYCQSRLTPIKVMAFYCIQSEHTNLRWTVKTLQYFPSSHSCTFLSPHSRLSPVKLYIHTWQKTNCSFSLVFFHHFLEIMHIHTHTHTPLVSLAHVFHLILPFLCLLTSLYSQLSIGTIPANYPQCHSHYFPISTANLLHTFLPPPHPNPAGPVSSQTAPSKLELSVS